MNSFVQRVINSIGEDVMAASFPPCLLMCVVWMNANCELADVPSYKADDAVLDSAVLKMSSAIFVKHSVWRHFTLTNSTVTNWSSGETLSVRHNETTDVREPVGTESNYSRSEIPDFYPNDSPTSAASLPETTRGRNELQIRFLTPLLGICLIARLSVFTLLLAKHKTAVIFICFHHVAAEENQNKKACVTLYF